MSSVTQNFAVPIPSTQIFGISSLGQTTVWLWFQTAAPNVYNILLNQAKLSVLSDLEVEATRESFPLSSCLVLLHAQKFHIPETQLSFGKENTFPG